MGIRFYCPNGHKLNVKEFQAGRKGICPYCAAKFVVPLESTRKSSKELQKEQAASAAAGGALPEPPVHPQAGAAAAPADPGHMPDAPAAEVGEASAAAMPQADTGRAQGDAPAAAAAPSSDPLAEAGDVVWYVRPPSGGQFGPAGPDIMREWINEGRVSADSHVWREGWRDWQEASAVFPHFRASEASPQSVGGAPGGSSVSPNIDTTADATIGRLSTPWHPKTIQAAIISALMLAIIILLAVFMFVLFREPENPPVRVPGPETNRAGVDYPAPLRHRPA